MAMAQNYQEIGAQNDSITEDVASLEKWNSISTVVDGSENSHAGGFDCNICLDSVQDPVVTLCGHLYCWPCIYKWIHLQSVSPEVPDDQQPQCPVCKTEVSQKSLIPLYGRGKTTKSSETKAPQLGIVIPRRPPGPACGYQTLITTSSTTDPSQQFHHRGYPQHSHPHYPHPGSYTATTPMLSLSGTTTANLVDPMIGMFGEMIYARLFGNPETALYTYPNSYHLAGSNSPRVRRQVMQADKSLGRICFFLCCCIALCLFLF